MHPLRILTERYVLVCLTSLTAFVLISPLGLANENTVEYDTSVAGQLVPTEETVIQVKEEELDIQFELLSAGQSGIALLTGMPSDPPIRVEVTAKYRLHNPASKDIAPQLAFPILRSGPSDQLEYVRLRGTRFLNQTLPEVVRRGVRSSVRVNDEEIPAEYVSFESLFEKGRRQWSGAVREWLAQWPDLLQAIEAVDATAVQAVPNSVIGIQSEPVPGYRREKDLSRRLTQLAVSDRERMLLNLAIMQWEFHGPPDQWDLDVLSFLHSTLKEGEDGVRQFQTRWGVEPSFLDPLSGQRYPIDVLELSESIHWDPARLGQRIDFLRYQPSLASGKDTIVEVRYSHLLDVDMYGTHEPYTYQFQYILKTSTNWKSFGPIRIRLSIPNHDTGYSMSLPMKYEGEQGEFDRFTYTLPGSEVSDNLLVGLGIRIGYPGDRLGKSAMDARGCWEKYLEDPDGPFADDLLARIGREMMRGAALQPEEYRFWVEALQVSPNEIQRYGPSCALARRALMKIPPKYHDQHINGKMLITLYPFIGKVLGYGTVHQIKSSLDGVRRDEWVVYNRWYASKFGRQANKNHADQLAEAHRWTRGSPVYNDLMLLCENYLSGFDEEKRFFTVEDRSRRYEAILAQSELAFRLRKADNLGQGRLAAVRNDYIAFWTLYDTYRDLPESDDLLRLLE